MKPDTQTRHEPSRFEQSGTSDDEPASTTDTPEQTAEPDGQFPENLHGTLDDHQAGEDPTRGNDPNGQDASLTADPDGTKKVAGLRRDAGTT